MKLSIFLSAVALLTAPLTAQQGGFLGVSLSPGEEGGTVISEVHPGTAAEVAGLHSGDVIVAVDSQKVKSVEQFVALVGDKLPGDYLQLTVRRKGEVLKKAVILGRRPKNLGQAPTKLFQEPAAPRERVLKWRGGDELEELEMDMEELHEHLMEMGGKAGAPHIQFRGMPRGQGRVLQLKDLESLDDLHGALQLHGLDLDGLDDDLKVLWRDGEGVKGLKGLKGLKGADGKTFALRFGDQGGLRHMVLPDGDGEHEVMRFEVRTESNGGDVEEFLDGLKFDFDTGSGEGVRIVLPGNVSKEQRERIRKQLTGKFGEKATIDFNGEGFKVVIKGGSGSHTLMFDADDFDMDDSDVRFNEPFEIDIEEIEGGSDLRALFSDHEGHGKPESKSRGIKVEKKPSKEAKQVNQTAFYHDLDEAYRASRASGKPVLLDFYADWCGPCRRFGDEVLTNAEHSDLVSKFVVAKVNVDENGALAEKFGVQGIPDVRVLDGDGIELMKIVGYGGADAARRQLEAALSKRVNKTAHADADAHKRAALEKKVAELRRQVAEAEAQLVSPHGGEL
jgi:thiol-disulfide isomerase/thioredoxin